MSSLALMLLCGGLVAVGVYLILERSLSRIILGLAALGNGINILFLIAGGRSGEPPIVIRAFSLGCGCAAYRSACSVRARATRSRTASDGSPRVAPVSSSNSSAGTAIWISNRSSSGPEMRAR